MCGIYLECNCVICIIDGYCIFLTLDLVTSTVVKCLCASHRGVSVCDEIMHLTACLHVIDFNVLLVLHRNRGIFAGQFFDRINNVHIRVNVSCNFRVQ